MELSSTPTPNVKSKLILHVGGKVEIGATFKYLKDARLMILNICPPCLPVWPLQKLNGFQRSTVDWHSPKEAVVLITVVMLAMISLLEQGFMWVQMCRPVCGHQSGECLFFFSILIYKKNQKQLTFMGVKFSPQGFAISSSHCHHIIWEDLDHLAVI